MKVAVKTKRTGWQLVVFIALPLVSVVLAAALVAGGYRLRNQRSRSYNRAHIESDPNDASASNEEGNVVEEEPTLGLTTTSEGPSTALPSTPSTCENWKPITQDSFPSASKDDLVFG